MAEVQHSKPRRRVGPDDRPGFKSLGVVEGYDVWAPTYDREKNPLILIEEPVTLGLIGEVRGLRVLDLGCGTGRYALRLADGGATVIGVDPSKRMLELAKEKAGDTGRIEFHQGTIEEMRFPDAHFDLVVSALALSHVRDLEPTMREVARLLKGRGRIVISDIHPFWPISGHDYVEFYDETGQEYRLPEYPHLTEEIWDLFSANGMLVERIRELKIDSDLVSQVPNLKGYEGVPLAMIVSGRKARDA